MTILEENFKWHLEAFASELFTYIYIYIDFKTRQNSLPIRKDFFAVHSLLLFSQSILQSYICSAAMVAVTMRH